MKQEQKFKYPVIVKNKNGGECDTRIRLRIALVKEIY